MSVTTNSNLKMMIPLIRHCQNTYIPKRHMSRLHTLLTVGALLITSMLSAQLPSFPSFPPDLTVECDAVPATPTPSSYPVAITSCGNPTVIVSLSEATIAGTLCSQGKTIKRTYTATDNCGGIYKQTQTITVRDTKAPQIIFTAPQLVGLKNLDTLVIDCANPLVFDAGSAYALDACDAIVQIKFQDNLQVVGDCKKDGFLLLMNCSWIAEDDCGNKTEMKFYFKVVDKTAPKITNVPKNITVSCDNVSPQYALFPTFKDICDSNPTIFSDLKINNPGTNGCTNNYTITRTWIVTDKCGNSASAQQIITVEDKTPPVFSTKPKDVTVQFGQPIPAVPTPTATDNCAGKVTIKVEVTRTLIGCDSLITYKCTAADICGNVAIATQKITVIMPKPSAGQLKADSVSYCISANGKTTLTFTEVVKPVFPTGYSKIYFLIDKNTGDILQSSANAAFTVAQTGKYSIHTLIYNATFDPSKAKKLSDLIAITSCVAFDQTGVPVTVKTCPPIDVPGCVPPTLSGAVVKNATCTKKDAYISLAIPAGTYKYVWSNNATSDKIENLGVGTYSVTVSLANDATCFSTKTFTVSNTGGPNVTVPDTKAAECNAADGQASFSDLTLTYTWADGKITPTRKDLKSGIYYVTVTSKDSCSSVYVLSIFSDNKIIAKANVTKKADCADNNGSATIDVTGGSGTYTYSWGNSSTKTDLSAGQYIVTVEDSVSKCTTTVSFIMPNATADSANIQLTPTAAKCPNDLGFVKHLINLSANFVKPEIYKITNTQGKIFTDNKLPSGKYNFSVYNGNGCLVKSAPFEIQNPEPIVAVLDVKEKDCKGSINVTVSGGTAPYTYDWADIGANNDPKDRQNLDPKQYDLEIKDANTCVLNVSVKITDKTCNTTVPCKDLIPAKNISLKADDCNEGAKYCLPITLNTFAGLNVTDNGKNFTGKVTGCNTDTLFNYSYLIFPDTGKAGPYILQSWSLNGQKISGLFDNVKNLVDSMNLWDKGGNWKLNQAQFLIEGGTTKAKYGDLTIKQLKGSATATVQPNITQMIMGTSITLSVGKHFLIFEDTKTGCKDTLTATITCDSCLTTIYSGAKSVQADSCKGTAKICLDVKANVLKNTRIYDNGTQIKSKLEICQNGNAQLSLNVGQHLVSFKDTVTNCQNQLDITVTCKKDSVINPPSTATYIVKKLCVPDSLSFCFDTTVLKKPYTLTDLCKNKTYKAIAYKINNFCIGINAKAEGKDTLCMYVCSAKKCDTTYIVVEVCKQTPVVSKIDTIYKEVCLNKPIVACVGKTSVADIASVENLCASNTAPNAEVVITSKFNCVDITGKKVGKTTACIRVCSNKGICDTTVIIINVKDCENNGSKKLPVAVKDSISTIMEVPVLISPLKNDTINGTLEKYGLISMPKHGDVAMNTDGTLTYTPEFGFCEGTDMFKYYIENKVGKDTAAVCISIACESFVIYNGVSANGDGLNDRFFIRGIDRYPNNTVMILNRWGNMIYEKKSYRNGNGWDGKWNGQDCPDGTYFYHIEVPELNKTFDGFLFLHR
jgi:gliding motility-associated-like protein